MSKYAMSRYFGNGSGHIILMHKSDCLLFYWNGKADGNAMRSNDKKEYFRNGVRHKSLAALLRAVEAEHLSWPTWQERFNEVSDFLDTMPKD